MSECDFTDLGDVDKRMSRLMHRFLIEASGFKFHGAVILAPVCPKCGALHDWRMTTDISVKPEERGEEDVSPSEQIAVEALLEDMLEAVRNGHRQALRIDMRSSYDA
jgi:hypothetical protein